MAINDVSLTAGMRSNLVALQGTVDLLNRTQERLSTGKKVNTALDDPLSFFTAKALNSRAADLAGYKDGMSEAVQTIKAANSGISGIEGLLAQAKAVAATAKAGAEGGSGSYSNITVDLSTVTNGHQCRNADAHRGGHGCAANDSIPECYQRRHHRDQWCHLCCDGKPCRCVNDIAAYQFPYQRQ
jgi:hypothetical protein